MLKGKHYLLHSCDLYIYIVLLHWLSVTFKQITLNKKSIKWPSEITYAPFTLGSSWSGMGRLNPDLTRCHYLCPGWADSLTRKLVASSSRDPGILQDDRRARFGWITLEGMWSWSLVWLVRLDDCCLSDVKNTDQERIIVWAIWGVICSFVSRWALIIMIFWHIFAGAFVKMILPMSSSTSAFLRWQWEYNQTFVVWADPTQSKPNQI